MCAKAKEGSGRNNRGSKSGSGKRSSPGSRKSGSGKQPARPGSGTADPGSPAKGVAEVQGGSPGGRKEVPALDAPVVSPNADPGKPPASAKRIRRTNAEREADIKARDLEAKKKAADLDAKVAEQQEAERHAESTKAKPMFALAYSASFSLMGKFRTRDMSDRAKAQVQELYSLDQDACGEVAYRTARVAHKWVGLEWVKYLDEEAMLIMALVGLVNSIQESEERILKSLGETRKKESPPAKAEPVKPKLVQPDPKPEAAPVKPGDNPAGETGQDRKPVGPSGEDDSVYEFDDIAKVG